MMLPKWWFVLIIFYDTMKYNIVEMCGCQTYTSYKPYSSRTDYLVKLPNSKKIKDLALVGTHSSCSYNICLEKYKTQDLNIVLQLEYGIRFFDVGVRPQSNLFEIYVEDFATGMELSATLMRIIKFLGDYPGELIIMNIHQEYASTSDVTKNNCDIMNDYIENIWGGWRLIKKWRLNDNIGMYRGKILLASMDDSFTNCTFNLNRNCEIQNDDFIAKAQNSPISIHTKWMNIVRAMRNSYYNKTCFINDMSFRSSNYDRRAIAKDGGYKFDHVCGLPFNNLMAEYFQNPHRALIILLADFVTQELIHKISDSNFPKDK